VQLLALVYRCREYVVARSIFHFKFSSCNRNSAWCSVDTLQTKNQRTRTPNLLRPTALAPLLKRQIRSVNLDVPEVTSRGAEVFEESASWALVVGNSSLFSTSPGISQVGCKCYYRYSGRSFRKYRRVRNGSCGDFQLGKCGEARYGQSTTARPDLR
jgi:hypothetical protein